MTEEKKKQGVDRMTKVFFYLCASFCVSFFIWAAVSPLDIVSEAIGEVIPSSRVKKIQHLEGGIVRGINVKEGDTVKAGEALIELEATASDSTVEEINIRVMSLKTEVSRLESESQWFDNPSDEDDGGEGQTDYVAIDPFSIDLNIPQDVQEEAPDLVDQAKDLYDARRERFVNDIKAQKEIIKQREQDVEEIQVRIRNQKQSLTYVQEQIKISEDLLKDKLTSRYKHLGFLKEESKLMSKIQEDEAALLRAKSGLVAAKDELEQISNSFHEEVQEELRSAPPPILWTTDRSF